MNKALALIFQNKWLCFFVSCAMMVCAGTQYAISAISPSMKEILQLEQYEISLIASFANFGTYMGILPSFFHDIFGPRATCLLAGVMVSSGYFLTFCAVSGWFKVSPIVVACFFFVMGNGSAACYTPALSCNIKNFPAEHRGKVVGTLSACFGISGAFFAAVFAYVYQSKLQPFLFTISIVCLAIPLTGVIFVGVVPKKVDAAPPKTPTEEEKEAIYEAAEQTASYGIEEGLTDNKDSETSGLLQTEEAPIKESKLKQYLIRFKNWLVKCIKPPEGEDYNFVQMLCTLDAWLFISMLFAGIGSGLVILNNLGSMVLSYGGHNGEQSKFVIILAVANCAGRFAFGLLSDRLAGYASRVSFVNFALFGMGCCQLYFAFAPYPWGFYPGVIFTGFFYGGMFSMSPSFLSDRFGPKYFAVNFAVTNIALSVSSYLIATQLTALIYQSNIGTYYDTKGKICLGMKCFRLTFLITFVLCSLLVLVGFILMRRVSPMYEKKFKDHQNALLQQQQAAAK